MSEQLGSSLHAVLKRSTALLVAASMVGAACSSGPGLGEQDQALAEEASGFGADLAGISLSEPDQTCVVDKLSRDEAEALIDEFALRTPGSERAVSLPVEMGDLLAEALVDCVGADVMIRSGLAAFAGSASLESQACAGEEFDHDLLGSLLSALMAGQGNVSTEVEIEIGLVLGVCLTPEELLDLHEG